MVRCLIAIGSNTGDCRQHIQHAVSQIGRLADTKVLSVSQLLETAPVGSNTDQVFLNGAVAIETKRPALQLIQDLLEIEHSGGRDRKSGSGNRPIDLDILLYGDQVIAEPGLEVPHPADDIPPFRFGAGRRNCCRNAASDNRLLLTRFVEPFTKATQCNRGAHAFDTVVAANANSLFREPPFSEPTPTFGPLVFCRATP